MITVFEAGAVFKIIDEGTPALRALNAEAAKLDKTVESARLNLRSLGRSVAFGAATKQFATLNAELVKAQTSLPRTTGELKLLGDAAATARPEISGMARTIGLLDRRLAALGATAGTSRPILFNTFAGMSSGATAALTEVRALNAEWRALALSMGAAGRALRLPGARGLPAAGGGHRGGGFHASGLSAPIPGGHVRYHSGNDLAMAGAGAIAYGVYKQAELQDAIFQMKFHAGLPDTRQNDNYFRTLIQNTASETGFGYREIAEAATDEIRLMKGAGGKASGGLDILPEMLRAASIEARVKPGTTLSGAMDSLIQSAHMAQEYGIDDVKGMAPFLAFLSTANPATMPQMVRAASYAMPTLHSALGIDPADVLLESTALARAGATNTKSGTWLQTAFERALPPDPRFVKPKAYQARIAQMRAIGLVDENGKSTVLNAAGKLDIDKLVAVVQHATATMDTVTKNSAIETNFQKTGARGIFLLTDPKVVAANAELKKEFPEFKNRYETFFGEYGKQSPVQKARQSFEDLTNVLADIGEVVLPPLTVGLDNFDKLLRLTTGLFPATTAVPQDTFAQGLSKAFGRGMGEGAATGAIIGGVIGGGAGAMAGGVGAVPGAMGGAWTGGYIGAGVGGAYEGGKYIWHSLTAPQAQVSINATSAPVNIDGQKLAELVTRYQVSSAAGPAQGAPFHDPTHSTAPLDYAFPF